MFIILSEHHLAACIVLRTCDVHGLVGVCGQYAGLCELVCKIGAHNLHVVKTEDGSVVITEVKPFGKRKMDAVSYVNGVGKNHLLGKVFQ